MTYLGGGGRREGGTEGRREGGKEGRREGGKEGRREGERPVSVHSFYNTHTHTHLYDSIYQ
jgi:hypothetical protein